MANPDILYSIRNLTVEYQTRHGVVKGVDDVSLDIRRGEILGLVGESGSGKSTLGKAMMRLRNGSARITAGELWFDGQDLMKLSERQMRDDRESTRLNSYQEKKTASVLCLIRKTLIDDWLRPKYQLKRNQREYQNYKQKD